MNRLGRSTLLALIGLTQSVALYAAPLPQPSVEFLMIHSSRKSLTRGAASIGMFTPAGPKKATLRPGPRRRVAAVALDPQTKTWYAQRVSQLGVIDVRGKFLPVEKPEDVRISHPAGLAFDARKNCVLHASQSGAGTVLWEYFPRGKRWNEVANLGGVELRGLACDANEGLVYMLEMPRRRSSRGVLRTFNRNGAAIEATELSEAIPFFASRGGLLQLVLAGGALWVQTSHHEHPRLPNEIRKIEIDSGEVTVMPYNESARTKIKTWPKWPGGPVESVSLAEGGAAGRGYYSNYWNETPTKPRRPQRTALHVVAVGGGEMSYGDWLAKLKKVSVSTDGKRLSVSIESSSDKKPSAVVEVIVARTKKPITLALVTFQPVLWSITPERGARIARVVCFDYASRNGSQVVGVEADKVSKTGSVQPAHAWEITEHTGFRFDEMIQGVRKATSLREVSFQGIDFGTRFHVPLRTGARSSRHETVRPVREKTAH